MTPTEARNNEFEYTGMSASGWNREKCEEYKARASQIRKTYKGADFRIVYESQRTRYGSEKYMMIYGNKIFRKVMHFNQEATEKRIDGHAERLAKLEEEYKQRVEEENKAFAEMQAEYNEIMSLKK